jgi:hypothetical protein
VEAGNVLVLVTVVVGPVTVAVVVSVAVVVVVAVDVLVTVVVVVLTGRVVVEVTVVVVIVARVNAAEAELRLVSVAMTVCEPGAPGGAVNVAVKVAGEEEELVTVAGEVVTGAPSYLIVIVELGANPDPDTVTMVPGVPVVGLRIIPIVTPNGALAIRVEPKNMSTNMFPYAPEGTIRDVDMAPLPSDTTDPELNPLQK